MLVHRVVALPGQSGGIRYISRHRRRYIRSPFLLSEAPPPGWRAQRCQPTTRFHERSDVKATTFMHHSPARAHRSAVTASSRRIHPAPLARLLQGPACVGIDLRIELRELRPSGFAAIALDLGLDLDLISLQPLFPSPGPRPVPFFTITSENAPIGIMEPIGAFMGEPVSSY